MSLFPKQIAWTEPWGVEYAKEQLRLFKKEMPPFWRMAVYCIVLPIAVMSVAKAFLPTLGWGIVFRGILAPGAIVLCMLVIAICPQSIHIFASGVMFQRGNAFSRINIANITAFSFETRSGKRYFVVSATNSKGAPYERRILMPKKKVSEQDIINFLYEMNLAYLIRIGER